MSEFGACWEGEKNWPELRNLGDFEKCFEWTYLEMVHDLCAPDLTRERQRLDLP